MSSEKSTSCSHLSTWDRSAVTDRHARMGGMGYWTGLSLESWVLSKTQGYERYRDRNCIVLHLALQSNIASPYQRVVAEGEQIPVRLRAHEVIECYFLRCKDIVHLQPHTLQSTFHDNPLLLLIKSFDVKPDINEWEGSCQTIMPIRGGGGEKEYSKGWKS